jgi:hypothetical protein
MRTDLKDIIATQPTQHSLDWYRARLGRFTGSQVGRLMKSGRGKDEVFSKDALTYINEVVAERMLNPSVVMMDELFEEYLLQVTASSKALAWGNDQEMNARGMYVSITKRKVTSCGAIQFSDYFADSPDGLCIEDDGAIEIKCPQNKIHTDYLVGVHDAESLKAIKPEYYWQCMAHMTVSGADWCDWMSYCPFSKKPLHVVRIERDSSAIATLLDRLELAEQRANEMIQQIQAVVS